MAAGGDDIDFKAIGKGYEELLQAQALRSQRQQRDIQNHQRMGLGFRKMKFEVSHVEWEDRSNVMGAHAFAQAERSLEYSGNAGAVGSVQATQKKDDCRKITITKGRIADNGTSLNLPLPENPACVRQLMGCEVLKIDPSKPEQKQNNEDKPEVKGVQWENLPPRARVEIQSSQIQYKGRFSCRVYPKGSCLLDGTRSSERLSGSNPPVQGVLSALKKSNNRRHQQLVKNFYDEEQDQTDSKKEEVSGPYYWKMEGYYEFRMVPSFSINKR